MAMITKNREMLLVWLALPLCLIVILAFNANALDTLLTWLQQAQSYTSSLLVASLIYTLILAIPYMPSVTLGLVVLQLVGDQPKAVEHLVLPVEGPSSGKWQKASHHVGQTPNAESPQRT